MARGSKKDARERLVNDRKSSTIAAAERARSLAELAEAIDQAQRLAWTLGFGENSNPEAAELYLRLELVKAEVESLRGSRWAHDWKGFAPDRTGLLPKPRLTPSRT